MSKGILPKVSYWSDARRNYCKAQLALRFSLKCLKPGERAFCEHHKRIYTELLDRFNVLETRMRQRVFEDARGDFLWFDGKQEWVNLAHFYEHPKFYERKAHK